MRRPILPLAFALLFGCCVSAHALPKRLIILLDSIGYNDIVSLQTAPASADTTKANRPAFQQGYFPASRLISTFPSASDVAWTEILSHPPVPGYQRSYYSIAENCEVVVNALTTPVAYETQVTWRLRSSYHYALSFIRPVREFKYEVTRLVAEFLATDHKDENYYALILSTDSAQHMGARIPEMLCALDKSLQYLRERYRTLEGRELEILILSDHSNNKAGRPKRVAVKKHLQASGYRIQASIRDEMDIVLPTAGIESWVEIHNAASQTVRLVELLSTLRGVDVVSGRLPGSDSVLLVMNSKGERARIEWNRSQNQFRYVQISGDPLEHAAASKSLRDQGKMDADGFASGLDWETETMRSRYPVALERIARGHACITMNPATVLVSLANDHAHMSWIVDKASRLRKFAGTHGGLDDLNSTGFILSSFAPTDDTTTARVGSRYGNFPGSHARKP